MDMRPRFEELSPDEKMEWIHVFENRLGEFGLLPGMQPNNVQRAIALGEADAAIQRMREPRRTGSTGLQS